MTIKTILSIYDFDHTFFKSPKPPKDISPNEWWFSIKSLIPPHVPKIPPSDWFITKTIESYKNDLIDPSIYCVIMTGRTENLRNRIEELVHIVGIPDEIILNPNKPKGVADSKEEHKSTEEYKINNMINLLVKNSLFDTIHFWEDRFKSLSKYEYVGTMLGIKFHPHLVIDED